MALSFVKNRFLANKLHKKDYVLYKPKCIPPKKEKSSYEKSLHPFPILNPFIENESDFRKWAEINGNINLDDIKDIRVRILWIDFEEIITKKTKTKTKTSHEILEEIDKFCDKEENWDALECKIFDI